MYWENALLIRRKDHELSLDKTASYLFGQSNIFPMARQTHLYKNAQLGRSTFIQWAQILTDQQTKTVTEI
jgi:hypothetical protein